MPHCYQEKMMDIQGFIEKKLAEVDVKEMVRVEVVKAIQGDIKRELAKAVRREIDAIIKAEIDIVLSGPVDTDDGWGKRESYPSFELLFKKEFRASLDNTYQMRKTIDKAVKDKVATMMRKEYKGIVEKIVSELVKEVQ